MTRVVNLRKKTEPSFRVQNEIKKEATPITENVSSIELKPKEGIRTDRFEWETPSFYNNPQKKYLVLVVIALLGGAGTLIFYNQDVLMAIFLILSSFVIVLYANKKPSTLKVVVNNSGVSIDDTVYYYRNLKSFWLDYNPHGIKELSLEAKKWYIPYIRISIEKQNPVSLRSLIINFVPEKEHEKSLVDLISRKIGL